jgi:hypothetical protein
MYRTTICPAILPSGTKISSAGPHKDHITDWIVSQTSKGRTFQPGELRPADLRITGDVAVGCYWMTYKWLAKDGSGEARTIRGTHTWIRQGKDWRITGGMSMPEPATSQK